MANQTYLTPARLEVWQEVIQWRRADTGPEWFADLRCEHGYALPWSEPMSLPIVVRCSSCEDWALDNVRQSRG